MAPTPVYRGQLPRESATATERAVPVDTATRPAVAIIEPATASTAAAKLLQSSMRRARLDLQVAAASVPHR
ncbi:hypothetical protein ON010_g8455 [Phytophthora cinnamomi]|nr:hypothetical protein ON010_g8455 [Phytophthora cinnamomi]